jgi:hypothetical protein
MDTKSASTLTQAMLIAFFFFFFLLLFLAQAFQPPFFAPPPFRLRIAINRRDSRGTITRIIFPPRMIRPRVIHRGEARKKFPSTEYNLLSCQLRA